jgi:hypothetical protein
MHAACMKDTWYAAGRQAGQRAEMQAHAMSIQGTAWRSHGAGSCKGVQLDHRLLLRKEAKASHRLLTLAWTCLRMCYTPRCS